MALLPPPTRSKIRYKNTFPMDLTWPLMWTCQLSTESVSLIWHTGLPPLILGRKEYACQ